jgi:hypothetical protein
MADAAKKTAAKKAEPELEVEAPAKAEEVKAEPEKAPAKAEPELQVHAGGHVLTEDVGWVVEEEG